MQEAFLLSVTRRLESAAKLVAKARLAETVAFPATNNAINRAVVHVTVDCFATDSYSKLMCFRRKKPKDSIEALPSDAEVRAQIEHLRQICDKKRYGMVSIKLSEALDALHKKF